MMLNSDQIKALIESGNLVSGYLDLSVQLQPAGFDLSVGEVRRYVGQGAVDFDNKSRVVAETSRLEPDASGWWSLSPGPYILVYNEVVKMPLGLVALARSRSTVLRNGASVETAVWDPGYEGRSSSLLVVSNPAGLRLSRGARVAQLVFFPIEAVGKGYDGVYQKERVAS